MPVIDHSGPNLAGPLTGTYETPDRISGTWSQSAFGVSGTYVVDRLGDGSGEYRFTGRFGDPESGGALAIGLTGTAVSGEAFDVVTGETYTLSGSLSGDLMTLTASNGSDTVNATATLGRDVDGNPVWLDGEFDGVAGSFVQASACRLN